MSDSEGSEHANIDTGEGHHSTVVTPNVSAPDNDEHEQQLEVEDVPDTQDSSENKSEEQTGDHVEENEEENLYGHEEDEEDSSDSNKSSDNPSGHDDENSNEDKSEVTEEAHESHEPENTPQEEDEEENDEGDDEVNDEIKDTNEAEAGSPNSNETNEDQEDVEGAETSSNSDEIKATSTGPSSKDDNVQYDLLQRQAKYIMDSDMLNLPQFKQLSQEGKINALVRMLNSNDETAMPNSSEIETSNESPAVVQQVQEIEARGKSRPDLNSPMSAEERERYAVYLHGENKITEMHDIPPKSRLFIGNLPLKNVSKEDLFRIFSPYGHILQINIKNAFGFIQYNNPKSVKDAIESESQEQNFGKKLILEISSSNARPQFDHGDHGINSSSTFISSSKRPFQNDDNDAADMYNDNQNYKKSKRRTTACVIYVKRTADRGYANEVFNHFRRGTDLETDMIFLKPRMELRRMINEVAYDGVWGVILVNKTRNVDIQTFYKGPQGETKFDEYISISADDAVAIFNNLKSTRGATSAPPIAAANPYAQQPSMAAPQQPQSQGYYGGYGMPPPMHQQPPPPAQQPPYVHQGYGMPLHNQGYAATAPAPMGQPYGRYQGSPPAIVEPAISQPQLTSLLGGNGGQMNQQQLLAAIQNLPPNVVSNLLSMAQQQQQPQQPQAQQQLLGLLQSMQGQQAPQQNAGYPPMAQSGPPINDNYAAQQASMSSVPAQQVSPPPQQQHQQQQHQRQQHQQQQQQQQATPGNNVQSLLDSLAKLQK